MLTVHPDTKDNLVAICVSEQFTTKDFDTYRSLVKERIEKFGAVRVYFEMKKFNGWEVGSFIENAVFDIIHGGKFGKVAMVGEKLWQQWAATLASPVKREGVRYFNMTEKELALKWLNE